MCLCVCVRACVRVRVHESGYTPSTQPWTGDVHSPEKCSLACLKDTSSTASRLTVVSHNDSIRSNMPTQQFNIKSTLTLTAI